jgi:hypothetical protein
MLRDQRARQAWQMYFLKAEAVLSPLSPRVKRELIDDLKTHVLDILAHEKNAGDEAARVERALSRVGDPREYLAPILADAVFRAPPQTSDLGLGFRTLALYAKRGTVGLLRVVGLLIAAAAGVAMAVAAFNSLLRPDNAGVFLIAPDTYQVRVLGLSQGSGEQLLTPLLALLLIAAGAAVCWAVIRGVRGMLTEMIAASR